MRSADRVIVTMRWGSLYTAHHVNTVYAMVRRHLSPPFRFVCFTDDPADLDPGIEAFDLPPIDLPDSHRWKPWRKVSLFRPDLGRGTGLEGDALFLDLDLVVMGGLDPFFDYPGQFCVIHNWTHPTRRVGNTSVYRWRIGDLGHVYERFVNERDAILGAYRNSQTFVSDAIGTDLSWWPDDWCRSFKKHAIPRGIGRFFLTPKAPQGTRILVFHGDPKPEDAIAGRWPGGLHKYLRPSPWLAAHYRA